MKVLIFIFVICNVVFTHPGRLDSSGGHYDRRTGSYHYHRMVSKSQPVKIQLSDRKGKYISDKDNITIEIDDKGNGILINKDGSSNNFYIGKSESTSKEFIVNLIINNKEYKNVNLYFKDINTIVVSLIDKTYTFKK